MRYAILSDIHGNLQAWEAVYRDIQDRDVDRIICLGDAIGYGPRPLEVLAAVREHARYFFMGDFEAVVSGRVSDEGFDEEAKRLIPWMRQQFDEETLAALGGLDLEGPVGGIHCAHANPDESGDFKAIRDEATARSAWEVCAEPLILVGQSRKASMYVLDDQGTFQHNKPRAFKLEDGYRFIVNVGSVGFSRDGDYRASYCIYDDYTRAVSWYRVPFDLNALKSDVVELLGKSPVADALFKLYVEQPGNAREVQMLEASSAPSSKVVPGAALGTRVVKARKVQGRGNVMDDVAKHRARPSATRKPAAAAEGAVPPSTPPPRPAVPARRSKSTEILVWLVLAAIVVLSSVGGYFVWMKFFKDRSGEEEVAAPVVKQEVNKEPELSWKVDEQDNLFNVEDFEGSVVGDWSPTGIGSIKLFDGSGHSGSHSLLSTGPSPQDGPSYSFHGLMRLDHTYNIALWAQMKKPKNADVKLVMIQQDDRGKRTIPIAKASAVDDKWVELSGPFHLKVKGNLLILELRVLCDVRGSEFLIDDATCSRQK